MPPAIVYITTPTGNRKQAAAVGMPVRAVTTAEPPVSSMAVTFSDARRLISLRIQLGTSVSTYQNISHQSKDREDQMCVHAIPSSNNLKEGMSVGSLPLQFNCQSCEQQDLNGSSGSIPKGPRDAISICHSRGLKQRGSPGPRRDNSTGNET